MNKRRFSDFEEKIEKELNGQSTDEIVRSTAKDVKRIMHIMYGNGDPTSGWIVRFDRLERDVAVARWVLSLTVVSFIGLAMTLAFKFFGA